MCFSWYSGGCVRLGGSAVHLQSMHVLSFQNKRRKKINQVLFLISVCLKLNLNLITDNVFEMIKAKTGSRS